MSHRGRHSAEVIDVTGQDGLTESFGEEGDVRIDHVGRPRVVQEAPNGTSVIEGVNRDHLEEPGEPGLPGSAPPDLGDDRRGRAQDEEAVNGVGEKGCSGTFVTLGGDQDAGVEDHVCSR